MLIDKTRNNLFLLNLSFSIGSVWERRKNNNICGTAKNILNLLKRRLIDEKLVERAKWFTNNQIEVTRDNRPKITFVALLGLFL